ncbi:MAG: WD40 repeat domain-containing protein [Fimbriiglobus sp.]
MRWLVGHKKDVRAVANLPDGRLVSGGSDRTVRVWDLATWELVRTIPARTPVYAVAVTPDGNTIAYAGRRPGPTAGAVPIQTFRLAEGLSGFTFHCPYQDGIPRSIWSLSYSADGLILAAAGRVIGGGNMLDGGGAHWFRTDDASANGPLASMRAYALRFAPAGDMLAVTGDAVVAFYATPQEPEPVVSYRLQSQWAAAVAFLPGSPRAVVGVNSALYFVDTTTQGKPHKVKTGFRTVTALATAADGRAVFVGGKPGGIEVYDPETGELRIRYDFGVGGVHAVAAAPDGTTIALAGDDGLAVFDYDG